MADAPAHPIVVTIDGPAGAGKTTVARAVARALGLPMLDTGAIYRAVALWARRRGVDWDDEAGVAAVADGFPIAFEAAAEGPQRVLVAGEDVTTAIRTPEIAQGASKVSAWPAVRTALLDLQRALGAHGCVAEGRDAGSVVFPDAPHKFFLTADLQTRAARRHRDVVDGQGTADVSVAEVEAEMAERDTRDSSRAAAPLRQASDATLVDSSGLGIEAVVEVVLDHIRGGVQTPT